MTVGTLEKIMTEISFWPNYPFILRMSLIPTAFIAPQRKDLTETQTAGCDEDVKQTEASAEGENASRSAIVTSSRRFPQLVE